MNGLKESIKNNKRVYGFLKPQVDAGRKICYSVRGIARRIPCFQSENIKGLKQYHNKFRGERCFVVANGPSLRSEDLDMIQDEYSFGCNGIDKILGKTSWHPTFWCVTDENIIDNVLEKAPKDIPLFTTASAVKKSTLIHQKENYYYVNDLYLKDHIVRTNMISWWAMSATVTVFMIELAMFMGFSEIVLLGVDCTFKILNYQHFDNNYIKEKEYAKTIEDTKKFLEQRGMTAEEYDKHLYDMFVTDYTNIRMEAEKRNIRVVNATRGGALEVYPRVKLEKVLQ